MKKINKKEEMDIVFLLDRSGSMRGSETDTIGGYNSYIEAQKKNNVKVTTILFDNNYEKITDREDINNINELTKEEYYVRGSTALLDAIGESIKYMDKCKSHKAMFIITTDGYENASRKYTKEQIKKMIKTHDNYEFIYIGADIDSYSEAESIGISKKNTANYQKNRKGIEKLFMAAAKASDMMCCDEELAEDWKSELS